MNTPDPRQDETAVVDPPAVEETPTDATEVVDPPAETETPDEKHRAPRRRALAALGVAAALALGGAVAAGAAHKDVQIDLDGSTVDVGTFAGSVGSVLAAEGIEVGEHDLVVPGVDEPLADGAEIVVRTAEQVEVEVDGRSTVVWTIGDTAAQTLAEVAASGREAVMTASRSEGRLALDMPLVAHGPVTFVVDGESRSLEVDGVADLSTALLRAEIEVGEHDTVTVTTGADGQPVVTVTRVASEETTRTEALPFETVERGTDDLYKGERRVVDEGREGARTYTYLEYTVDGEVASSQLIRVEVTRQPQDRVVEYGTAQRPAPTPRPTTTSSGSSGSSGSSSSSSGGGGGGTVSGDVWAALAQCESGGNPTTNTGNGYYGLYQFSLPTWQAVGGTGLPSEASAAEQTQRAQILQARSGWGQWPACSAKLGLR